MAGKDSHACGAQCVQGNTTANGGCETLWRSAALGLGGCVVDTCHEQHGLPTQHLAPFNTWAHPSENPLPTLLGFWPTVQANTSTGMWGENCRLSMAENISSSGGRAVRRGTGAGGRWEGEGWKLPGARKA